MKVEEILKGITPEVKKREIEKIQKVKLPAELQKWVKEYEKVGERDEFIWKWIYNLNQIITFSSVEEQLRESLLEVKTSVLIILDVLLNDVADNLKNQFLLDKLIETIIVKKNKTPSGLNQEEGNYFLLVNKFWKHTLHRIECYPRYKELNEIFNHDVFQLLASNKHDYLIVKYKYFINETENWLYPPCTMGGMVCGTIDILCSPKFDIRELGAVREVMWEAQKMARIGNWVSTWEREIDEDDFTSEVFMYAVNYGLLKVDDLERKNKVRIIEKIRNSRVEKDVLSMWEKSYAKINKLGKKIKTVEVEKFLEGLEKLLILQLISKKLK